jgi:hypothetical protein
MRKFAVIMQLPEGKLPGFYAQVIKALATKAHVFDRHKEVLIINSIVELAPIEQILEQYSIVSELVPVLQLPNSAILKEHIEDFGFTTLSGNIFLYESSLILFTFDHAQENSDDYTMALSQLDEHIVASFVANKTTYYIAEKHLHDCFYGIAKAYKCTFKLENLQNLSR